MALAKQKAEATLIDQPKPESQQPHLKELDVREEMDRTLEAIHLDHERELLNENFELQCLEIKLDHEQRKQEMAARRAELTRLLAESRKATEHTHSTPIPKRDMTKQEYEPAAEIPETPKTHYRAANQTGATPFLPDVSSIQYQLMETSRLQYQSAMDTMRLPPANITPFDGNPIQYWQFRRTFENTVMKETVSGGDKLARLIQYTKGEANECISYCVYHKDTEYGFQEAWELFESRFGQGHDVAAAWVRKVTTGPKKEDGKPLCDFADKLAGCQATLAAMECSQTLQIDQLIQIADRLPRHVRAKWV